MPAYNCIVVLGPTASGKTHLACQLAYYLDAEVISADSRQVYRRLDIGTGKDLEEYVINGKSIPYHIIDIIDPGEQFYLHQYIEGLKSSFDKIIAVNKIPVICGGTGLYLDTLHKDFSFTQIKEDDNLREKLDLLSKEDLLSELKKYPSEIIQHIDLDSKKRIIRGIEIAEHFLKTGQFPTKTQLPYKPYYIGIKTDVDHRRQLISERLKKRLDNGLIDEIQGLLKSGITHERLLLFGLEYKFVSFYLQHKITKEELFQQLQTAIFQFAKRQMTWFRKMEKEGILIHWVSASEINDQLFAELRKELARRNVS